MAANRLQRWATYLSGFSFEVQYILGKDNGCADALSRLSLNTVEKQSQCEYSYLNFISDNFQKPIRCNDVARETEIDETMKCIAKFVQNGWPCVCPLSIG